MVHYTVNLISHWGVICLTKIDEEGFRTVISSLFQMFQRIGFCSGLRAVRTQTESRLNNYNHFKQVLKGIALWEEEWYEAIADAKRDESNTEEEEDAAPRQQLATKVFLAGFNSIPVINKSKESGEAGEKTLQSKRTKIFCEK
uniref:Uncharacterized protein n=1 Tax=Megaselia scalaris TaxID=36166 RepID=T1GYV5_MEGSC